MRTIDLLAAAVGTALALAMPGAAGAAITLTTLHNFAGSGATPPDGANPQAALVADSTGALYGTTAVGGASGGGTVFKLALAADGTWSESVLHGFCAQLNCGDGATPYGGLIFGSDGALYGTTSGGGAFGGGTVFRLAPAADGTWSESVLHSFCAQSNCGDGELPYAGLIQDPGTGALYGTTEFGGANGAGTVFALTPPATAGNPWNESVLHSFAGGGGGFFPLAGLLQDPGTGALYGTTRLGGAAGCNGGFGCGVVFALTPPSVTNPGWSASVLYSFLGGSSGANPVAGLIQDRTTGALYGTTVAGGTATCASPFGSGCGTVFALTPPATAGNAWNESVLYSFTGGSDGGSPYAGLIADTAGALYGTTGQGGASGAGAAFKLAPPSATNPGWSESVLWSFSGSDGANPQAALIGNPWGTLYGTTDQGGSVGVGAAFRLVVPASFAGLRGQPNCVGKSISPLAQQYGGLTAAAAALGFPGVQALQDAIKAYCAG